MAAYYCEDHHHSSARLLQCDSNAPLQVRAMRGRSNSQTSIASSQKIWRNHTAVVMLSALVPLISAVAWFHLANKKGVSSRSFSAERLGGQMSQSQAKAVDVVCSAVVGPCLMAALNYLWFGSARVSAVNEHHSRSYTGIPLTSLIAVSTSTGGSYDFLNFTALLRGKTWRLLLFALLILASAIAKLALSNVVAYEAFIDGVEHSSVIRSLSDRIIDSQAPRTVDTIGLDGELFNLSIPQRSEIANRVTGLLTGLSFSDATSKLDHGAYIGVNSTTGSMRNLSQGITRLFDVPGFRLTVNCVPEHPDPETFSIRPTGGYTSVIESTAADGQLLQAHVPGIPADIQGAYNDQYQFAAFSSNATDVYLGYLDSFNSTGGFISSTYGIIRPVAVNMTSSGFSATKSIMSYWGVRCWLNRQEGRLNYTRDDSRRWTLSESSFLPETVIVPSSLAMWQTNLNYRSPGAAIPGIGPALATTAGRTGCAHLDCRVNSIHCPMQCDNGTDFSKLALNYLYASAESQRILYEVAASNATRDKPIYWYNVSSTASKEYYRMTYVPAILATGLLSCFAAAAITTTMAVYVHQTYSARVLRRVDALRLVVDCVDGLQRVRLDQGMVSFSNSELEKWASHHRIAYEKVDESSPIRVRIFNISTPA